MQSAFLLILAVAFGFGAGSTLADVLSAIRGRDFGEAFAGSVVFGLCSIAAIACLWYA